MNNIDLSKLKEYSKDDIHEMIINGEIDHDFICEYISKRDKVYNKLIDKVNELQQENKQLKKELKYTVPIVEHNKIVSEKLKENKQLKERIGYLERSINRKEDTIISYRMEEYPILEELKRWLEEAKTVPMAGSPIKYYYGQVLLKIKELEAGVK